MEKKVNNIRKIIDLKLEILLNGIDCNFDSLKEKLDIKNYRVNKIRVSDRHFIDPKSEKRKYIPDEIIIGNISTHQTIAKVYFNQKSKLLLEYQKNSGKLLLKNKENSLYFDIDINLVPLKKMSRRIFRSKDGREIEENEIVTPVSIDRLTINPFDGCAMWSCKNQCAFCGADPKRLVSTQIKPSITTIPNYPDIKTWWNKQKQLVIEIIDDSFKHMNQSEFQPHLHFIITTGYLYGFEWNIVIEILKIVNKYIKLESVDSHLALMPPKNTNQIKIVKELGIKNIAFNLECFDKKIFETVCKGKNSIVGYDKFRQQLKNAVKIFGAGHVRTNLVLGLENLGNLIQGCEILAKEGIVSDYSVFFPRPASQIQKPVQSLLTKEEIIDFTKKLIKIYKDYNFKPFTCNLSSRTSIANDIFEYYHLFK